MKNHGVYDLMINVLFYICIGEELLALIHYEAMIYFHLYPFGETVAGITPGKVHCIAASFFFFVLATLGVLGLFNGKFWCSRYIQRVSVTWSYREPTGYQGCMNRNATATIISGR